MNTAPIPQIESDPGRLAGFNVSPAEALRLGVLASTKTIADQSLPQIYMMAGETYDS